MPVPVPRLSKPVAHPVLKHAQTGDADPVNPSVFQHLTRTLPVSPTGPPPSFGTREQWINSLPSWRRTKPRRIWEDDIRCAEECAEQSFQEGLTVAGNASVIKGARAQACIPPLYTLLVNTGVPLAVSPAVPPQACDGDADDEMSSDCSAMGQDHHDNESQWSASSPTGNVADPMDVESRPEYAGSSPALSHTVGTADTDRIYERGAFTPVFEDESPGTASVHDVASSPIEPVTPFGEFVDRAVAATQTYTSYDHAYPGADVGLQELQYSYQNNVCGPQCYQAQLYQAVEQPKEQAPAPELVVTPSATDAYKKLAEPLAEWVANYVWKVCTTGMSLPSKFARPSQASVEQYSSSAPAYLAGHVHSLLLSTLLQPSAVFLAVWYIARLPVFFGAVGLGADHVKELRFRVELLGDSRGGLDREAVETSAPFRLIVLGCMLANKWLDDHTFSNKTWHTISNVPIHSLNRLEFLTLAIFEHDLSIAPQKWTQWLARVLSYHLSLSSPSHPQPISRPSTNPHSIVRKAIEELIQAPAVCDSSRASPKPEPVFLGLEERRKEKLEKDLAAAERCVDVLEIDLDEDGPLREEYLPKRRISAASSMRSCASKDTFGPKAIADQAVDWEMHCSERLTEADKPLPPPAKWSPSGDEPILRERNRVSGHYVAVQPPLPNAVAPFPVAPQPYQQVHEAGYRDWVTGVGYLPVKPQLATGYAYGAPALHHAQPAYNPYPYIVPIPISHSRSQSHSYDQDNTLRNHARSYSQTRFQYRCSDIRMTAMEPAVPSQPDTQWVAGQYGYAAPYGHTFGPHPSVNYQSNWLRT